jgi:hypothetical protein
MSALLSRLVSLIPEAATVASLFVLAIVTEPLWQAVLSMSVGDRNRLHSTRLHQECPSSPGMVHDTGEQLPAAGGKTVEASICIPEEA